ncbi:MAG: DUF4400 domain-containing protein [Gammaproteobacteria bacterium]
MKASVVFALILWLAQFAVVGTLVSRDWVMQSVTRERDLVEVSMGARAAQRIATDAARWYDAVCIRTGIAQATYDFLIPTPEQAARGHAFHTAGDLLFPWLKDRLDVLWTMAYQLCARLALLATWLPFLAVALVPAVAQGWLRRRIRQTTFAHASAFRQRYAMYLLLLVLILLLLALFAPLAIAPMLYPPSAILVAAALEIIIANTQKRL